MAGTNSLQRFLKKKLPQLPQLWQVPTPFSDFFKKTLSTEKRKDK